MIIHPEIYPLGSTSIIQGVLPINSQPSWLIDRTVAIDPCLTHTLSLVSPLATALLDLSTMTPTFSSQLDWQQAEVLMQPALIRVIDNIRKQLERSPWRGNYENVHRWPSGTPEAVKTQVMTLQRELETATPERTAIIQRSLDHLPRPYPGYELKLTHQDQEARIDLWQLCYQVCFVDYAPDAIEQSTTVTIDTSLLDMEAYEIDWHRLDEKAKQLVETAFAQLSNSSDSSDSSDS
jgi:hypothetical protein